jgi:phenylpyruvate C(3)-methyltransferase
VSTATGELAGGQDRGILAEFHQQGEIDSGGSAERREGVRSLSAENSPDVFRARSFFHRLVRGSARHLREIPEVIEDENRKGALHRRDSAALARVRRKSSGFCHVSWFREAVGAPGFEPRAVAAAACGSGERLMRPLQGFPQARGVGIDVARPALDDTERDAAAAGPPDRRTLLEADVLTMDRNPSLSEDVRLVTCFRMEHVFRPRENVVRQLRRIRALSPGARRPASGDATRSVGIPGRSPGGLALGFGHAHHLRGTFQPTVADRGSVFEAGGRRLGRKHTAGIAVAEVIFEPDLPEGVQSVACAQTFLHRPGGPPRRDRLRYAVQPGTGTGRFRVTFRPAVHRWRSPRPVT